MAELNKFTPVAEEVSPMPDRRQEDVQRGREIFSGLQRRISGGWDTMRQGIKNLNVGRRLGDYAARMVGGTVNTAERTAQTVSNAAAEVAGATSRGFETAKSRGTELLRRGGEIVNRQFERMSAAKEAFSNKVSESAQAFSQRLADRGIDKRYSGDISQALAALQEVTNGNFQAQQRADVQARLSEAYQGGNSDQIQSALEEAQQFESQLPQLVAQRASELDARVNELRATVARAKQRYGTAGQPA